MTIQELIRELRKYHYSTEVECAILRKTGSVIVSNVSDNRAVFKNLARAAETAQQKKDV